MLLSTPSSASHPLRIGGTPPLLWSASWFALESLSDQGEAGGLDPKLEGSQWHSQSGYSLAVIAHV